MDMSRQNGIGLDVDANGFPLTCTRMLVRAMTIFILFACGKVIAADTGWMEKDRPLQTNNTRIIKSAQHIGEGKLTAKPVKVSANAPVSATRPTRNHSVASTDKEEELTTNTSRMWAMLLVGILLVSLRIRGSITRSNKVY